MRIYIDVDSETLVQGVSNKGAVSTLTFIRSATAPLVVQFVQNGEVVDPGAASPVFVLKTTGRYDETVPLLGPIGDFVKSGTGTAAEYAVSLNFLTTALNAAFVVDADDTNDVAQVEVMGQFAWTYGGRTSRSPQLKVKINNNVYRGDETPAAEEPAPGTFVPIASQENVRFLSAVTGLVGGTATDLDATVTNGVPSPRLFVIAATGLPRLWLLRDEDGTEATDEVAGIIRPTDYVDPGNKQVFEAIG